MKRWTNLALFVLLGLAFITGWLAFFSTAASRGSLIVHAASGYALIAITAWKSVIASRAIQRRRPGWGASLVLTLLVLMSVLSGILHSTGVLISAGAITAMEVHVGAALVAVPFAAWHIIARRIPMRAVDLSRRSLLRAGALVAGAGLTYAAGEAAVRALRLPGSERRFTGSYEFGSLEPSQLPGTQWMFDSVPVIDPRTWRLTVRFGTVPPAWTYEELLPFDDPLMAPLDCTGGAFSTQAWSWVRVSRLIADETAAGSLNVRSST